MENKRIRWRKIGGGTFRMGKGRIIKPNQVFRARPSEIPEGFRDVVVPIDDVGTEEPEVVTPQSPAYEIRQRSVGWYDVINVSTGKVINERALRKSDAEALLASLN